MLPRSVLYFFLIAILSAILYYLFPNFTMYKTTNNRNIIVVGGGLAGLCASIEAVRSGAHVTIIEKEKMLGGNSAKATSGINGAGSDSQSKIGIVDKAHDLIEDTLASGGGFADEHLVKVLAESSADAIRFLKSFGLDLSDVVQLGGHKTARTHRIPPAADGRPSPIGFTILSTLRKYVEGELKGSIDVLLESRFVKLIFEESEVVGVAYSDKDGETKNLYGQVVLTAGGFANDRTSDSLLSRYAPQYVNLPTTNGPWATGDIIKATWQDQLDLIHMQHVQIHPTGFLDSASPQNPTKFLAPEALRGVGGILLDREGRRFVNELGRRDHVTQAIFNNGQHFRNDPNMPIIAVMLLNEEMIIRFGAGAAGFYKMKGLIVDAKTLEGVSSLTNYSYDVLQTTIQDYRISAAEGKDPFGKQSFPISISDNDHFYIAYITPSLHYCMGGISINVRAQVLRKSQPVVGLFAAGEVSGGVHGENRLGGNSLLECVVFGRIAGRNSAMEILAE